MASTYSCYDLECIKNVIDYLNMAKNDESINREDLFYIMEYSLRIIDLHLDKINEKINEKS